MVHDPAKDDDEPPLDPAAERVRKKLARLLLGSLGIMALGLIAVFAAIVYRVGGYGSVPGEEAGRPSFGETVEAQISLPAGARLVSTTLDGDRALLHLEIAGGAASLLLVDLATGVVIGRYGLQKE